MRKLNLTDGRTDGRTDGQTDGRTDGQTGGVAISPVPGPTAPAGDNNTVSFIRPITFRLTAYHASESSL